MSPHNWGQKPYKNSEHEENIYYFSCCSYPDSGRCLCLRGSLPASRQGRNGLRGYSESKDAGRFQHGTPSYGARQEDEYPGADPTFHVEIRKVVNDKGEHGSYINFDEMFASKAWQKAVNDIHKKDRNIDGIGFFDHDYWLMSQDFVESFYASDIKIENIVVSDEHPEADAVLQLHRNEDIANLRLHLIWEDNSWKVDNIIDFSPYMGNKSFNYREQMKEYLEE